MSERSEQKARGLGMVDEVIRGLAGPGREVDSILSAVQSQGKVLADERLGLEKAPPGYLKRNGG